MTNNRQAGKRWERWFATRLKPIFPEIRRNAGTQSQSGGVDLENTPGFNFEVKGGKKYKSKMIRGIIEQIENEGNKKFLNAVLVKPLLEDAYVVVPFGDFLHLLDCYMDGYNVRYGDKK